MSIQVDYTPDTPPLLERCRFRTVLEGQEVECTFKGEHTVHKYIAPKTLRIYRFELVDLEASEP